MKKLALVAIAFGGLGAAASGARATEATQPPAYKEVSLAAVNLEPPAAKALPSLSPRFALVDDKGSPQAPDADLDLTPKKDPNEQHLTESWWFWGAVAGVVVTTVAIVLIAGRPLEKPDSDLGDMRAFR